MTTTTPSIRPIRPIRPIRAIRRLITVPLALGLTLGVGACGEEADDVGTASTPSTSATPATSATSATPAEPITPITPATPADPTTSSEATTSTEATTEGTGFAPTASAEFCTDFVELDLAFQAAPGDDPDAIGPYVEAEVSPRLASVRSALPGEVSDEVSVMLDAIETVSSTGDFSVFETEAFADATATVYPYLGPACGLPVLDVLALDYTYGGVPATMEPGPTVVVLHNESETGEAHEMAFARINDDVDLTLDELLAIPMEELDQSMEISGGVYALAGDAGGTILPLTPGRWVYVCFIPVGSIDGAEGTGPPHIVEGMSGELIVA